MSYAPSRRGRPCPSGAGGSHAETLRAARQLRLPRVDNVDVVVLAKLYPAMATMSWLAGATGAIFLQVGLYAWFPLGAATGAISMFFQNACASSQRNRVGAGRRAAEASNMTSGWADPLQLCASRRVRAI